MTAQIINGKKIAQKIVLNLKEKTQDLIASQKRRPCLAVVLVGKDPASQVYVSHKRKTCEKIGYESRFYPLEEEVTQAQVEKLILELNSAKDVDGILVQLPLPKALNQDSIINKIIPYKDVDGLTAYNQGLLSQAKEIHAPCTPKGIIKLLDEVGYNLQGKIACVIGRSLLVGAPICLLLRNKNATVINVHSKTKDPTSLTTQADVLVVAAGVHHLVDEKWLKPGALVIDVGIHRVEGKLSGDVDFNQACKKASYITPVPGGVGPMTVACLMENTYHAYLQNNE